MVILNMFRRSPAQVVMRWISAILIVGALALNLQLVHAAYCEVDPVDTSIKKCNAIPTGSGVQEVLVVSSDSAQAEVAVVTDGASTQVMLDGYDTVVSFSAQTLRISPEPYQIKVYMDGVLQQTIGSEVANPSYTYGEIIVWANPPSVVNRCAGQTAWEAHFGEIRIGSMPDAADLVVSSSYRRHLMLHSEEGALVMLPDVFFRGNPAIAQGGRDWPFEVTAHYHIFYELKMGAQILDKKEILIKNDTAWC